MSYWDHTNRRKAPPSMTTVSHPDSLTSFPIRLDPTRLRHPETPVSEYLYSGFLEHLGRCIYGGIVDDPKNPSPADLLDKQEGGRLGVRKDVKKLVARNGELEIPMMRWPGGESMLGYMVSIRPVEPVG
jgi:alpha-N-arabinofuranosidase